MGGHDDDDVRPLEQAREVDAVADHAVARRGTSATCGSWKRTSPPRAAMPAMTSAAGELRSSWTFGLKATPTIPTRALPERPAAVVERLGDEVDDVARHRQVDVAGELDEAVDEVELAGPPRQVVRVDRDAVAADARDRA